MFVVLGKHSNPHSEANRWGGGWFQEVYVKVQDSCNKSTKSFTPKGKVKGYIELIKVTESIKLYADFDAAEK